MDSNFMKINIWYITGVSSGVGLCLCEELLKCDTNKVVGTSRGTTFSKTIRDKPNFLGLQVDITNSKSVKESIEKSIQHFGGLTHVVNNAGFGIVGAIEEISEEENRSLMEVLYFGPLNVMYAVLPYFRSKRGGYIFNISSITGFRVFSRFGNYGAAKAALTAATNALHEEAKPFNIKVVTIVLGYIDTEFHPNNGFSKQQIQEYETIEYWKNLTENISKKLLPGCPRKVAQVIIGNGDRVYLPCSLWIGPIDSSFAMAELKINEINDQLLSQKEIHSNVIMDK